tara:strand:- start:710 stop:1096 length:387 start_codon:yes stop_codon:yes gene_type:complete
MNQRLKNKNKNHNKRRKEKARRRKLALWEEFEKKESDKIKNLLFETWEGQVLKPTEDLVDYNATVKEYREIKNEADDTMKELKEKYFKNEDPLPENYEWNVIKQKQLPPLVEEKAPEKETAYLWFLGY